MNFFRTQVTAPVPMQQTSSMDRSTLSGSSRSTSSYQSDFTTSSGGGHYEDQSETTMSNTGSGKEEKVYVAVTKDPKEWKANLLWVLQNIPQTKKIVILHIHQPATSIPLMGGYFPADQLNANEVSAFRKIETRKMQQNIEKYIMMCSRVKVKAEKVITVMDDIADGIVTSIAQHGIRELFLGAAADKNFSKKLKVPTSKTAISVQQQADQTCKIWFLCKGTVICTREAVTNGYTVHHRLANSSSISSQQSEETPKGYNMHSLNSFLISSDSVTTGSRTTSFGSRVEDPITVPPSPPGRTAPQNSIVIDLWDGVKKTPRGTESDNNSFRSESNKSMTMSHAMEDETSKIRNYMNQSGNTTPVRPPRSMSETAQFSNLNHYVNDVPNKEMYMDFESILSEAEKLRRDTYLESLRRQNEERELNEISNKSNETYQREISNRREVTAPVRVRQTSKATGFEEIRQEKADLNNELQKSHEQRAQLELELINTNRIVQDLQEKLSEAHCMLFSLEKEHEQLRQDRDRATREVKQLRVKITELETGKTVESFSEFTYEELQEATNNFDEKFKIGEGGYGSVYKGVIGSTSVAIKLLNPEGMQGQDEFHKEMDVLSKVRHPNLVTLVGSCPEAWALVYEFLPNGSLEDRLSCKDNTPPLTWQARCRIVAEICSALVFLHTHEPLTVIHGDLKPANILLDADFASRLADFGICRLLESNASTILFRCTHPMGTFVYMDPEFLASGELRPCSDVYSFGIILLRLLTGRQAMGIINQVHDAVDEERLDGILDKTAGEWPFEVAKELAELGLKCCEIKRKHRPDLGSEAWKILEPLMQVS